jgi:hypothetical protein
MPWRPGRCRPARLLSMLCLPLRLGGRHLSFEPSTRVPSPPGAILRPEDCSNVPCPRKQKFYLPFVAKPQLETPWIRYKFVVSQLHRFCVSAGSIHWAASPSDGVTRASRGFLSLKLMYQRSTGASRDVISGFADSYWETAHPADARCSTRSMWLSKMENFEPKNYASESQAFQCLG